ncbi:DUF1203 domain-containing protein [uncultured Aquimarina sp.]|uniref:DUF1203 domain-containing protein n=1 Tax=uncultured Aquimarina sp. TaxID=575652 RepID=UPI003428E40A
MIDAKTVPGATLYDTIQLLFNNSEIKYLHIHNSNPGCYNCQIDRITQYNTIISLIKHP